MDNIKLLSVGDGAAGKTCLFITYATGRYPDQYVPTSFDNYAMTITHNGKGYTVGMWDTAGGEDYHRLRPLSYPQTDVFFICFDISSQDSFENIEHYWLPELNHHMPYTPKVIVGCKSDLRNSPSTKDRCMTSEQIITRVKHWQSKNTTIAGYQETSSLESDGLSECFDFAVAAALHYAAFTPALSKRQWLVNKIKRREQPHPRPFPMPPMLPPKEKEPPVEIEPSKYTEQWLRTLESPQHCDIVFIVEKETRISAHKLILCSASRFFSRVFIKTKSSKVNQLKLYFKDETMFTEYDLCSGKVPGISNVEFKHTEDDEREIATILLCDDITERTFKYVLQFLYIGFPNFENHISNDELDDVVKASTIFQLWKLKEICSNWKKAREEEDIKGATIEPALESELDDVKVAKIFLMRKSGDSSGNLKHEMEDKNTIGIPVSDETRKRTKYLFFNQPLFSDISFKVEGKTIYAHKVVLSTRCDVMSVMFGGQFLEGATKQSEIEIPNVSHANFLALLEYLYTNDAPGQHGDLIGILCLADQFCESRLITLCELQLKEDLERSQANSPKKDADIIGLLQTSQTYNAKQLELWCLHFIATNYDTFQKKAEFHQLKDKDKNYIDSQRWPPESYLNEIAEYEKRFKSHEQKESHKEKCSMM